jgi:hypothetical protein
MWIRIQARHGISRGETRLQPQRRGKCSGILSSLTEPSRWISTDYTPGAPVNSANVDTFTGSARGSTKAKILPVVSQPHTYTNYSHTFQLSPLPFKQANVSAMEKKIQELNAAADPSVALQPEEGAILTELFGMLSTNNTALLTAQHVSLVTTLINRWPASQVFPRKSLLTYALLLIFTFKQ